MCVLGMQAEQTKPAVRPVTKSTHKIMLQAIAIVSFTLARRPYMFWRLMWFCALLFYIQQHGCTTARLGALQSCGGRARARSSSGASVAAEGACGAILTAAGPLVDRTRDDREKKTL